MATSLSPSSKKEIQYIVSKTFMEKLWAQKKMAANLKNMQLIQKIQERFYQKKRRREISQKEMREERKRQIITSMWTPQVVQRAFTFDRGVLSNVEKQKTELDETDIPLPEERIIKQSIEKVITAQESIQKLEDKFTHFSALLKLIE